MPRIVFYSWTALGSAIWVGGLAILGYVLEEGYQHIEGYVDPIGKVLVLLVVALFVWQLWRVWTRKSPPPAGG